MSPVTFEGSRHRRHERQMAASGIADDADPVGIHSKRGCNSPQEPDGAFHVFDLRRPGRFRRQAVGRQQADESGLTE